MSTQPTLNFEKSAKDSLLQHYVADLLKWNKTHNLIGKTTEENIIKRHIEDSLQIKNLFKVQDKIICDFGSGAGLPSIPLAIEFHETDNEKKFHLFESNTKKASFLSHIASSLKLKNLIAHNQRIEAIKEPIITDVITARAFASLLEIFDISKKFLKLETRFILHKGISVSNEILEAKKKYEFEYKLTGSKSGEGFILECSDLRAK